MNLAPADLPKQSGRFDLSIALGILAASGQIPADRLTQYEFADELALTGELRPVRGALAMALAVARDGRRFIVSQANSPEAALAHGAEVYAAPALSNLCAHLAGRDCWHRLCPLRVPQQQIMPICRTSKARPRRDAHWKLPQPARTAC